MTTARLSCCLLLATFGGFGASAPVAANTVVHARTPDQIAREFYGWYVGLMVRDKEPSDDPARYAHFVSAPLRARIKRQMDSPEGMDVDYFTRAQDYLPDWPSHIAATPAVTTADTARTTVTLGVDRHPWRLMVALVKEGGDWRIAGVQKAR